MRWYVYELVDPANNLPFYIGKGSGSRIMAHGRESDTCNNAKTALIDKIGFANVIRRKIAYFYKEHEAYSFEGELIRSISGLTNIKGGTSRQVPAVTFFGLLFDFIEKLSLESAHKFLLHFQKAKSFGKDYESLINIVERFIESKTKVINNG